MNKRSKSGSRRRSRSLVGFASQGLCETISKSLDPSERLLFLLELSFQYALSTVQKEVLPNDVDVSAFQQRGVEVWEKLKSTIKEKNLVQLAVDENCNVSDSFSSKNLEEYNQASNLLKTESDKWTEQLSGYRESLTRKIDSPYIIDAAVWKDKEQLYDYSDVIQSMSSTQDDVSKQIASLSKYKTTYRNCLHMNHNINKTLLLKCQNYYEQNKLETPKTVIRRMMSSRRNASPYKFA